MKNAATAEVRLEDYAPWPWEVTHAAFTFRLDPDATRVISRLSLRPRPGVAPGAFFLHGEGLDLISASIDGSPVRPEITTEGLTCAVPDGAFVWEAEVEIAPAANTALEGLYLSNGIFATQCEAEGFRRITYYPDRPDVLAPFDVRIEADAPVLLSNGNAGNSGPGWAEWHDPWPKPSYLFALVAGDLRAVRDRFTTRSGRAVELAIWVRPGDENRCSWALESLRAAMRWDEQRYGREYDLDIFNIVAVDDFNAGAMENKGLNIFNSALVLASPETATDSDYERIESVIAHEYFHNWTGNRVTCRDWFQLCLKEGLTVFRDQEFTKDLRSAPVKRIEDANLMRARQFREDGGPLAHPVRPESFVEINNFYTITVYEKGAEVVGMLKRLVGKDDWRRGCDLYFDRHDGQAVTIEDWLAAFEEVTGRDLSQFKRWYSQAGTPRVTVIEEWDGTHFSLTFRQSTPPTPGQPDKAPLVIPFAMGLLHPSGAELLQTTVLDLTEAETTHRFNVAALSADKGLETARPIASLLREFSAPVIVERDRSTEENAFLLAHDSDPFQRWDAGRALARTVLCDRALSKRPDDTAYLDGLAAVLSDATLDPAFKAQIFALPSEDDIAQSIADRGYPPEPLDIRQACDSQRDRIAARLEALLDASHAACATPGPYRPDAASTGRRALAATCLALLSRRDGGARARAEFNAASDMTRSLSALSALLSVGAGREELAEFGERWRHDRLVMDKWFSLQVARAAPEEAAATARRLMNHPLFTWVTPNRVRAVIGALAGNAAGFHHPSGAGYDLYTEAVLTMDARNPQTAARLSTAFETWRRYGPDRQAAIRQRLDRIAGTPGLSRDLGEMAHRMLG